MSKWQYDILVIHHDIIVNLIAVIVLILSTGTGGNRSHYDRLQCQQDRFQAIVEKYETVRSVQGGLVDRLDQCVSAHLLAQPSMHPETPTAENGEAIKELDAQEQEAVPGRNSEKSALMCTPL